MGKHRKILDPYRLDSRSNPKQITDEKLVTGKKIALLATSYMGELRIDFEDGTFIIVQMDYSGCYYEGDRPNLTIVKEYRDK